MARVILQPYADKAARKHFVDTIDNPVPLSLIQQYLPESAFQKLALLSGENSIPVWGVTPGREGVNIGKWQKVEPGDVVLFARQRAIRASAVVMFKVQAKTLAENLWGTDNVGQTWEYVYFLKDVKEHLISVETFNAAASYESNNNIQGFSVLTEEKSADILSAFNSFSHSIIPPVPPARSLVTLESYSREEVHRIFSPESTFTPQAGTWGLQGIVQIPGRPGDYIFFVTYGTKTETHEFEESISESGILKWQSQPKQALNNPDIQSFITHDESINSIYLFIRPQRDEKYIYTGKLKYLSHNAETEKPVWFNWEILEWSSESEKALENYGFNLVEDEENSHTTTAVLDQKEVDVICTLTEITPPTQSNTRGITKQDFNKRVKKDYSAQDKKNKELGFKGEKAVVNYETEYLIKRGLAELASKVRHIAHLEGDGAGYDVLSFDENGNEKYIEVKTTRGSIENDYFLSANEVAFSEANQGKYYLYRVCEYSEKSAKFFIHKGSLKLLFLKPTEYKVCGLKSSEA